MISIAPDKKILDLFKKRAQLEVKKNQFTSGFKQTKDVSFISKNATFLLLLLGGIAAIIIFLVWWNRRRYISMLSILSKNITKVTLY